MAKSAIFSADPTRDKAVVHHEEDGVKYLETRQDVDPLIQGAKIIGEHGSFDKDMKPVAVIPDTVLNKAFNEGWFHDQAAWRRWANNPDNKAFRITEGRL